MTYLKKRKMHEIAQKILTLDCDVKLKDCEYRFFRGTEWLRFSDKSYIYELCSSHGGNYLSVRTFIYDEGFSKRVELSFKVLNGWGKHEVLINDN